MGSVALPTECFLVRKGERGLGGMNSKASTLMRCLERFTGAQRLDAD